MVFAFAVYCFYGFFCIGVIIHYVYQFISKYNKKLSFKMLHNCAQLSISILLLFIGYKANVEHKANTSSIYTSASFYFAYFLGFVFKEDGFIQHIEKSSITKRLAYIGVSYLVLKALNQYVTISAIENSYPSISALVASSIAGFAFVMSIAVLISDYMLQIKKILSILGRYSLFIMLGHFLSFKFITLIQIHYYELPYYQCATFPVLYSNGLWGWIYLFAGLLIPVGSVLLVRLCKRKWFK